MRVNSRITSIHVYMNVYLKYARVYSPKQDFVVIPASASTKCYANEVFSRTGYLLTTSANNWSNWSANWSPVGDDGT